ncbi:MAG: hypothetical protein U0514_01960 [Candidatus Andersenbacteria bacterium]
MLIEFIPQTDSEPIRNIYGLKSALLATIGPDTCVVFDIGGVFWDYDFTNVNKTIAKLAGCSVDLVNEVLGDNELFWSCCRGEITGQQYVREVMRQLKLYMPTDTLLNVMENIWRKPSGLHRLVPEIATRAHSVCFLSNATDFQHESSRRVFPEVFALVPRERRFISHEIGVEKPNTEAFEHVKAKVPAARYVLVDDKPENGAGARACGYEFVWFSCRDPQRTGQ